MFFDVVSKLWLWLSQPAQFGSWADLWFMAGAGSYVWLAFAVTWLAVLYLFVKPYWQHRQLIKQYKQ